MRSLSALGPSYLFSADASVLLVPVLLFAEEVGVLAAFEVPGLAALEALPTRLPKIIRNYKQAVERSQTNYLH